MIPDCCGHIYLFILWGFFYKKKRAKMKPNHDYSSDYCRIRVKYSSSRGMILYVTKEMTVTLSADNSRRPTETTKSNKQITDNSSKALRPVK